MKAAFALWRGRIAPVFDQAPQARVIEAESGRVVSDAVELLADKLPAGKILHLAGMGVDTLVCGAMTRAMQDMAASCGMDLIGFVAGDAEEVVRAWLGGRLARGSFAMPGCGGRGRLRAAQRTRNMEVAMPMGGKGGGRGGGQGQGGGGRGMGGGGRGMGGGGGQGMGGGRGMGGGGGQGMGGGGQGQGRGLGGGQGLGQGGDCVCPQCGHKQPHRRGIPCMQEKCSKCGADMVRG